METALIFFVLSTIISGIFGLVMENKYLAEKKALANLRAKLEHDKRDENLRDEILEECGNRIADFTLSIMNAHEMDYHE